jgi:TolA-binding protein
VLLARINARALTVLGAHSAHVKPRAKRRTLMLLVAAAVLLVAGLASALLGGARQRPTPPPESTTIKPAAEPKPKPAPRSMAPIAPVQISEPSQATPSASPPRARDSKETALGSASELFAGANLLRRQGRAGDAAVKYELLLDLYPQAREVGPARLALAKYLQSRQPERALTQFRALASSGGALRAEALWGLSEVAAALDRRSVAEQALSDLRREFPDSPYANVARP